MNNQLAALVSVWRNNSTTTPEHHRYMKNQLWSEWPVLYAAIDILVNETIKESGET